MSNYPHQPYPQHTPPQQQTLHRRIAAQPQQGSGGGGGGGYGGMGPVPPLLDGIGTHVPHLPHRLLLDAASAKLLLPSRAAFWALLTMPLVLWSACVAAGMLHWEEEGALPKGIRRRDFEHPLSWFDIHVFRVWGPLLPLLPFLARLAAIGSGAWWRRRPTAAAVPPSSYGISGTTAYSPLPPAQLPPLPLRPAPTLARQAAIAYGVIIAVRILLYVVHVLLQRAVRLYLVSDHLLLAASMVACFQAELVFSLSDIWKAELLRSRDPRVTGPRQLAVIASLVLSVFLLVFVYGDMYCTARWYHVPYESGAALAAGAALFNAPVAVWLWRAAKQPPGVV